MATCYFVHMLQAMLYMVWWGEDIRGNPSKFVLGKFSPFYIKIENRMILISSSYNYEATNM